MVYLRARYYEPAMMRFSQKDSAPAEQYGPLSLNRYLYVEDNPVNYHDPDGEFLKRTYGGGSGRNFGTKSYASGPKSGTAGTAKKTSGQTTVRSRTSSSVTVPVKKTAAVFGKTAKSGNTGKNTVGNRKKTATAVSGRNKVTVINYKERNGTGQYVNIPVGHRTAISQHWNSNKKGNHLMQNGGKYIARGIFILIGGIVNEKNGETLSKSGKISGKVSKIDSIENLDELLVAPDKLTGVTGDELYKYLIKNGYEVKPLSKGSFKGIPFDKGGGFKVNWGGDRILQYHPSKLSHHGGAYFKISSGKTGVIRIGLDGKIID